MSETASHKNRPDTTYANGAETRARIINAAIELFGERGYQAASTREIARRAGVNAPLLNYYFESKEGLYRACAGSIAEEIREFFGAMLEQTHRLLETDAGFEPLMQQVELFTNLSLDFFLSNRREARPRLFLLQDEAGNGPDSRQDARLKAYRAEYWALQLELVSRLTGSAPDDPDTIIRALTIVGQVAGCHQLPESELLKDEAKAAENCNRIRQIITENVRVLIRSWRKA